MYDDLRQGGPWNFSFEVKFYPVDPTLLREELTRYRPTNQTLILLTAMKLLFNSHPL